MEFGIYIVLLIYLVLFVNKINEIIDRINKLIDEINKHKEK